MGVQYNDVSAATLSDIVIANAAHWLFGGTGLSNGSILADVLGYETDSISNYAPAGTISVAHSPFPKGAPQVYADMSIYTAPSGANVFATGSVWWSLGLDSYPPSPGVVPAVQQATANFLSHTLQSPPHERLAATVATSSAASGYPASYAGDGNMTTQWVASLNSNDPNNNNAWIQLDFGARMALQSVKWVGAGMTPYPAWSPTDYSIQISDDGTSWQTVDTRSNSAPVVNGIEPLNAQARFLRMLTGKVGDGSGWSLSFFEFWAEGSALPTLSSLAMNPTSVTGGTPSTGTVTLNGPAPPPGVVISLFSNNKAATVPPSGSVTVPTGATTATFPVNTSAVAIPTTVTISASYGGGTQAASLTVIPPIPSSLTLNPSSVVGGPLGSSTGTVTLNGPAPAGGVRITLSSNNTAASVPARGVTVPAGANSATFTVNTSVVVFSTTVTISGSYNSSTKSASLTVNPVVPVL